MKEGSYNVPAEALHRRAQIQRIRAEVHDLLARRHRDRQQISKEIRMSLRRGRAKTTAIAGRIRYFKHFMIEHTADANRCSSQVWGGCASTSLEEQLIAALAKHCNGVTVNEIGNEMGIDWRELLETADRLTQTGRIERIGELFYPLEDRGVKGNHGQ